MAPLFTQEWTLKDGIKRKADIYDSPEFPKDKPVKQVYAILYNDKNEIAFVKNKHGFWLLPGGGTEQGETPLDTLVREVKEETNCDVLGKDAAPLYYQEQLMQEEDGTWKSLGLELRYIVPVHAYHDFIEDPDEGDTLEVVWAPATQITTYLEWWKDTGVMIQRLVEEYFRK